MTLGMGTTVGPVYAATVHYTARKYLASGSPGTMNVHAELYDGATLVATGATRDLPTTYTAYTDTFAGLAISSAAALRVKLVQDSAGTANRTSRFTYLDAVVTYLPITDSSAPTAPTNLSATAAATTSPVKSSVALSWTAATDNTGVTRYEISRGSTRLGETTGTSYVDEAALPNTAYSYTVTALDAAFNRSTAAGAAVTTVAWSGAAADGTAPTAPGSPLVTLVSPTVVNLSWAAATDNVGVTGYGLYRDNILVALVPNPITSTVTYSYNANSNRTSAGATTFTYNNADQLLNQTVAGVTRTFAYDAAGNQTSSPVSPSTNSSFTYDALNQPLTVAVPTQPTVTYTYDALGRRASRTASGATETYGYVGDLIARIDRGGGSITDSAIDAMGDRLTVGTAWTIPNVRGDVAGLLDSGQTAVSDAYRYDPFGVSVGTAGSSINPYRFQGRLLESTSGQYDFGARQYDPAIAAFTSLDTVMGQAQNPLSLNRYLYAHAKARGAPTAPRASMIGANRYAAYSTAVSRGSIHTLSTAKSRSAVLTEAKERPDAAAIAAEFRSPPITEVSLAVSFQPLVLGVIDVADLWREKFKDDFPRVQEQASIGLPQERFEVSPAQAPAFSFEMVSAPTLPRLWFLNEPGTELVQVQADWFARNWRRTEDARPPYPLYVPIRDAFARDFARFVEFMTERGLGPVLPIQAEITYINHIEEPDLSNVLAAVARVSDMPSSEATGFTVQYVLVEDEHPVGRLHLQATTAIHRTTGKPISAVTIMARGRPMGQGIEGSLAFLDFGATKALDAFIHSTRPEMHDRWRQES